MIKLEWALVFSIFQSFSQDFGVDVSNISVAFSKPETFQMVQDPYRGLRRADGVCETMHYLDSALEEKTIRFNLGIWWDLNYWQKMELVYHELGHCALGLSHEFYKVSIMNSFAPNAYWVEEDGSNWDFLVKRMKNAASNKRGEVGKFSFTERIW